MIDLFSQILGRRTRSQFVRATVGVCVLLWMVGSVSTLYGSLTPQWTTPHCPAVSFEQRAAHPWILCMALRQHRYPILLGPFMRAIHCSDWIRVQAIPMPHYALQSYTEGRHPVGRLILFSPDSSNPCYEGRIPIRKPAQTKSGRMYT